MSESPRRDAADVVMTGDDDGTEHMDQKAINEEYKIWKKNSPFLYDLLFSRALEWPSLTAQWFPDKKEVPGTNLTQHRVLLGTNTSGNAQNYLQVATVEIPNEKVPDPSEYDEQRGEIGGHGDAKKPFQFEIVQSINHPGEINKARYQPQNPNIIASLAVDGRVLIFDRTKHTSKPEAPGKYKQEIELIGHEKEGFALNWSPHQEGLLVTGNEDTTVRTWDIRDGFTKGVGQISAKAVYRHHNAVVNDVQFHPIHEHWIGTVSDDLSLQILDTRHSVEKPAIYTQQAHTDAVNAIAFHPKFETIVATGSADSSIGLWDLRMIKEKLHSLEAHRDAVVSLEWHPTNNAVLSSSSYDRRILFWDVSKIGEEQSPEEADDGPPELLFMHGGFTNRVTDFNLNKHDPWVMLATAEDNQLQVFRPARTLVNISKKNIQNQELSD